MISRRRRPPHADDVAGTRRASVIDLRTGTVYDVQNIRSWKKVPLSLSRRALRRPAYVNNDANCFAAGEKYFGKAKPYDQRRRPHRRDGPRGRHHRQRPALLGHQLRRR